MMLTVGVTDRTTGGNDTVGGAIIAGAVFGLLLEAVDEGPFSLVEAGLTGLAFCVLYGAVTVGVPYVKRRWAVRNASPPPR
jgi:hypothetical protein